MFCDENHPPVELGSLPLLHIKRHFKRQSPVTIDDLSKLVRVVKPLSERFAAYLKDPAQCEDPANVDKECVPSNPSLAVTFAVVNDEVCRVRVKEDRRPESDLGRTEKFDIRQTITVDKQLLRDPSDKFKSVMFSNRSDLANGAGLAEWTSVEASRGMLLCSNADIADASILSHAKNLRSLQATENAKELGKKRQEVNTVSSVRNKTLKMALINQRNADSRSQLEDLSTNHPYVGLKLPAISETMVDTFGNITNTNSCHSSLFPCASVVSCQAGDCMEQTVIDNYKSNTTKNEMVEDGSRRRQKHATSDHQFPELTDTDDWITSFSESVELKGGLKVSSKSRHGKDEHIFLPRPLRLDQKRHQELADEDILNEGWMELERAFKRRMGHHNDEMKHRKLEKTPLFYGRTILVGRHSNPLLIPLEDVSDEKHYKWKDGQLVSYMKDPRLEKHISQKKENADHCDLIQVSFAKSTCEKVPSQCEEVAQECWTIENQTDPLFNVAESAGTYANIFIGPESDKNDYESISITSKTPNSRSHLQNYSEQLSCHGAESIACTSKNVIDKRVSNASHSANYVCGMYTANEYPPVCAYGNPLEKDEAVYPIPVILSQSYFSYDEKFSNGPDDLEIDQNLLPPDWMNEQPQETQRERSSCCYVDEMLRNIYRCTLDARVISDGIYKDAKLMESLQCVNLALNAHSSL